MAAPGKPTLLLGVVSLLDTPSSNRVKSLWSTLEREFGLRGVLVMPYPHFSYQISQGYDRVAIELDLDRIARELSPFEIRTSGLSTFDGSWPVVFIAVEKDSQLSSIHRRVWDRCLPLARDVSQYYTPEAWIPHITLAHGKERLGEPLSPDLVQRVLGYLNTAAYQWTIRIDNIALVWDDGVIQKPVRTFPLQG
jgi:2'-5' RNA ligase